MKNNLRKKLREKLNPDRFVLPGYDPEGNEMGTFGLLLSLSALMSLLFVFNYGATRDALYYTDYETGIEYLRDGAVMADFVHILGWSLAGFFVTAAICLIYIGIRYHYLSKDTKSIYLMRRLPQKGELLRRCAGVPALRAVICITCAFLLLLIFFAIYMIATPDACLTPGQWAKIWR